MVRDEREPGGEARRELQIWTFAVEIDGRMGAGVFIIYWNHLFFPSLLHWTARFRGRTGGGVLVHELRLRLGSVGRNELGCFE